MFKTIVFFSLLSFILTIDSVFGSIFCKDSVIDAIAYRPDNGMWFIVSEGHFWWISDKQFPPPDSEAKPLPKPFKKPTAAVFIDSSGGCLSSRAGGVKPEESQIWITEMIGNEIKFIAYDTNDFKWRPSIKEGDPSDGIGVASEDCIGRARFERETPIDAMFAIRLDVYVIQGDKYSMVDCSFLCTKPEGFGDPEPKFDISDWDTSIKSGKIDAITYDSKQLLLFQGKNVYDITIDRTLNGPKGQLKGKKGNPRVIVSELLKVNDSVECTPLTTSTPTNVNQSESQNSRLDSTPESPIESKKGHPEKGISTWLIVVVMIVVLVCICCCCFGLF